MAETLTVKRERIERLAQAVPATHRRFIVRAVMERGLTEEDIEWNAKLGRPLHWKETLDPAAEAARRTEWTRQQPAPTVISATGTVVA